MTSDLLSETVKKDLRGAAFDPLNEALFAVARRGSGDRSSALLKMPGGSAIEEQKDSALPEGLKSKEHSTTKLRSLASLKNEKRVIKSEASPSGEP